jgi:putative nucleotidyltransferase with HDIG domain
MTEPTIQSLVKGNLSLPTIPEVMLKVQRIIEDPESGTRDLGELVAQDAPLAAKVLRIANSSYYGAEECSSTTHACTILGMRVLKNLVMQVAVMDQFEHLKGTGFDIAGLWSHAVSTAQISSLIASKRPRDMPSRPDEVYGCGLLHDIGKIVMLDGLGGAYVEIAGEAAKKNLPVEVIEKMKLGFDHTDVGSMVAERWGMPNEITDAIQLHHAPASEFATRRVAAVVWCANHVAQETEAGNPAAAAAILESAPVQFLALTTAEMDEILNSALGLS